MAGQGQGGKSGALQQRQKPVPHRLGEVQGSGQGRQQLARFHSTEGETEASEHESCSAHTHGLNAAVEAASPSSRSPICGAYMAPVSFPFPGQSQQGVAPSQCQVGVCVQEGIREGPGKPQRPSPAPCSSIILAKPSPIFPTRNLPSGKPGVWVVWDLRDDLHSPLPLPESGQGSHPLQAQS